MHCPSRVQFITRGIVALSNIVDAPQEIEGLLKSHWLDPVNVISDRLTAYDTPFALRTMLLSAQYGSISHLSTDVFSLGYAPSLSVFLSFLSVFEVPLSIFLVSCHSES